MRKGTVTWILVALAAASCRAPAPAPVPGPDPGHSRLTRLDGKAEDPCPVPGGVLFSAQNRPGSWRLCSVSNAGPSTTTLLDADGDVRAPAVSPDGTQVAFACNRRGTWDIYVSPLSDLSPARWDLVGGTDDDETGATWAPDGKRLAWTALDRRSAEWKLKVRLADGSVCDLGEGFAPAWHPSRDLIACQRASRTGGPWKAVILDVATGHATDLWLETGRGEISPSWTADGRWVLLAAVLERDKHTLFDGLWAISLEGARRVRLTQGGVEEWSPREGPDGRIVYARREGETVDLWSFPSPLRK